jgi:hypothetical protein
VRDWREYTVVCGVEAKLILLELAKHSVEKIYDEDKNRRERVRFATAGETLLDGKLSVEI